MYVKEFFQLNDNSVEQLSRLKPEFGYDGFGEVVYHRTYSRRKARNTTEYLTGEETGQENWADTVIRVTNGTFSIRKDWYLKNHITWNEDLWQKTASGFAEAMFHMYWLPPGRGLWAMGTKFVYERGSMALNNCGFTNLGDNKSLAEDYQWMMDALMMGVGVGFHALNQELEIRNPTKTYKFIIQDTRESWALSVKLLVLAYLDPSFGLPEFDYSLVRKAGMLIKGFGGLSSGPDPLIKLHKQIKEVFHRYMCELDYTTIQLKTDIANMIGCCVVAGNVRRSAELAMGDIKDDVFLNLKDYNKYPERAAYGWMSNNTCGVEDDEDFLRLHEVSDRVPVRGEPGIANWRNFPVGRVGKSMKGLKKDSARGLNPCGR